MNANSFLNCLNFTGLNTGTYVLGLYSFSSGDANFVYNQAYSTGYNYVSGYPFAPALPLVYEGAGTNVSGIFSGNQAYQVSNAFTRDFGILLFLNNSGCLNSGNKNQILISTTTQLSGGNSGAILGITPTNRLFASVSGYTITLPQEIDVSDLAFLSVQQGRFLNFGLFSIKQQAYSGYTYDYGHSGIAVQNLLIGGAFNYPTNYTGYSGVMKEVYLFSAVIPATAINSCMNCVFTTGYYYTQTSGVYNMRKITGSYWSGITTTQLTGYKVVSGNYINENGTSGTIYYNSGLYGTITLYSGLFPQIVYVPYTGYTSGLSFYYNTGAVLSGTVSNVYLGVPLSSGDIIEVYTYQSPLQSIGVPVTYKGLFPNSTQLVQLYGNGLAETSGFDFNVLHGGVINGYDPNNILLYDIVPSGLTMPYLTGYILTGAPTATYTLITGISGISMTSFNHDIYLNGQKMASGLNYTYTSPNLYVSGNELAIINDISDAPEIKFIPPFANRTRVFFEYSGNTNTIGTITGFSEQVWLNGLRQSLNIDYYKTNTCPTCTGFYYDPGYSFSLYSSMDDNINLFNIPAP